MRKVTGKRDGARMHSDPWALSYTCWPMNGSMHL